MKVELLGYFKREVAPLIPLVYCNEDDSDMGKPFLMHECSEGLEL